MAAGSLVSAERKTNTPLPSNEPATAPSDDAAWIRRLAAYRTPRGVRSGIELGITSVPFTAGWVLMLLALYFGQVWLYALLVLPTAGLLVRLFMIQHDCGHGSFFPNRRGNDWTGRIIGILTLTPYDHWRAAHAVHHATSGNLDKRGIGDVETLTVTEYLSRSRLGRLRYRLYRHPVVLFGLGPIYMFMLRARLPFGSMREGWAPWASTMSTNAGIALFAGLLIWAFGLATFLLVFLPVVSIAAAAGVWLFYVQHQFEETHWSPAEDWTFHQAALHGSSHYDLPGVLKWFTANIGIHHVHHLASRIPSYRLPEVLRDYPELKTMGRLTLLQSVRCVRLALWDESRRQMISFRQLRRSLASA